MIKELTLIMSDKDFKKQFGLRVRELRKLKRWTQKELAEKIDVRFPQLNKYECGLHTPPMEKLIELSEILNTTVDYLLTGNTTSEKPLHNYRLLERFRALQAFNPDDQETVIKLIDAMIIKNKVEGAIQPFKE